MIPPFCYRLKQWLAFACGLAIVATAAGAQSAAPRVLIVIAHPDDEIDFAGVVYKLTRVLAGSADLCVVTNGEGGYRYSTLAEPIYGAKLTREAVGRKELPAIRKGEVKAGGAIVGISRYFFLDQFDKAYTEDVHEVLASQWDSAFVHRRLAEILGQGHYDFVLVSEPRKTAHGAHQAASLMTLAAVAAMPAALRPVVMAGNTFKKGDTAQQYAGRDDFPFAGVRTVDPPIEFDLTQPFGYQDKLDYRIIVNWVIAEHKSQGLLQTSLNTLDIERFVPFAIDDDAAVARAKALFARLTDRALKP